MAPWSIEFSRQEFWSVLPFPSPGDLPDPGIELGSPTLQADSLSSEPQENLDIVGAGVFLCEALVIILTDQMTYF